MKTGSKQRRRIGRRAAAVAATLSMSAVAVLGLSGTAAAREPEGVWKYGWTADGLLARARCWDYGSYNVCTHWDVVGVIFMQ